MKRIGLISDTHGFLDPQVYEYFKSCDEVWHAGDFGTAQVSDDIDAFKPIRGVYGNVDDFELRSMHPLDQRFELEKVSVWMTHIGGYPGHYDARVREGLALDPPDLFICGHSHILRVARDKKYNDMLVMNPGAAGKHGFHKIRTLLRFVLEKGEIKDVEAIELGARG
jgi:putative phosphoesterase